MGVKTKSSARNPSVPPVEFLDALVRQSLVINPALRAGDSTTQFLQKLQAQAALGKKTPATSVGATPDRNTGDDPLMNTIALFFEKKRGDCDRDALAYEEREALLRRDQDAARDGHLREIVDFLVVVLRGAALSPTILNPQRTLLSQLGASEGEVLRRVREGLKAHAVSMPPRPDTIANMSRRRT